MEVYSTAAFVARIDQIMKSRFPKALFSLQQTVRAGFKAWEVD
jgi:hypothetical protein